MRVQAILHPILLTLAAVGDPAEAGFIGAAVRGLRGGVTAATTLGPKFDFFAGNIVRNVRKIITPNTGQIAARMKDRAKAVRSAMALSTEGKKALKYGFTASAISGTISGTISGHVSKSGKKRGIAADRAAMISSNIYGRQATNGEIFEPGEAPEGISKEMWDLCFWDATTAGKMHLSGEKDWIKLEGLPPVCVEINDKIGKDPEAGAGKRCGDGCIVYEGLDKETFDGMADYLNAMIAGL